MLKLFIVMVPMIAGAALATTVRAETLITLAAEPAPQAAVLANPASLPSDRPLVQNIVGADQASAAHLPEPAAWTIMLTGIGLVGALSRRRRAHAIATAS